MMTSISTAMLSQISRPGEGQDPDDFSGQNSISNFEKLRIKAIELIDPIKLSPFRFKYPSPTSPMLCHSVRF